MLPGGLRLKELFAMTMPQQPRKSNKTRVNDKGIEIYKRAIATRNKEADKAAAEIVAIGLSVRDAMRREPVQVGGTAGQEALRLYAGMQQVLPEALSEAQQQTAVAQQARTVAQQLIQQQNAANQTQNETETNATHSQRTSLTERLSGQALLWGLGAALATLIIWTKGFAHWAFGNNHAATNPWITFVVVALAGIGTALIVADRRASRKNDHASPAPAPVRTATLVDEDELVRRIMAAQQAANPAANPIPHQLPSPVAATSGVQPVIRPAAQGPEHH